MFTFRTPKEKNSTNADTVRFVIIHKNIFHKHIGQNVKSVKRLKVFKFTEELESKYLSKKSKECTDKYVNWNKLRMKLLQIQRKMINKITNSL